MILCSQWGGYLHFGWAKPLDEYYRCWKTALENLPGLQLYGYPQLRVWHTEFNTFYVFSEAWQRRYLMDHQWIFMYGRRKEITQERIFLSNLLYSKVHYWKFCCYCERPLVRTDLSVVKILHKAWWFALKNSTSGSQGSSLLHSTMPSQTDCATLTAGSSASVSRSQSRKQAGLRWGKSFKMSLPLGPSYETLYCSNDTQRR